MGRIIRNLAIGAAVATAFGAAPALAQVDPGCRPLDQTISKLQTPQIVPVIGGQCGGAATIQITVTGTTTKANAADLGLITMTRSLDGSEACTGPTSRGGTSPGNFTLTCQIDAAVFAGVTETYTVKLTRGGFASFLSSKIHLTYTPSP